MIDIFAGILLQASPEISLQLTSTSSSTQAEKINQLTNYFFIAAAFIMVIVSALTFYMVIRFRRRKNKEASSLQASKKWEIVMLGIPLMMVAFFFYLSSRVSNKITPLSEKDPDIIITGHQWWWQANYPSANVITANEIHLPVNKELLIQFNSADVIHSWWVPQFGSKMDMIPSQDNFLALTIKKPGIYYGTCSEFCGNQHAYMQIIVFAETDSVYDDWLMHHQLPAIADASVQKGKQLFIQKTCSNCHHIQGTEANGINGPDLTHFASRKTLLEGLLTNDSNHIEKWIREPQKIKPGCYMPDFAMEDSSVKAITAYLSSLK